MPTTTLSPEIKAEARTVRDGAVEVASLVVDAVDGGRLAPSVGRDVIAELATVAEPLDELAGGRKAKRAADRAARKVARTAAAADRKAAKATKPKGRTKKRRSSASSRVVDVPLADIHTDPARFQPRGAAFSEESARRVAEEFDPNLFEPVVLWADSADGLDYVLAGHSRHEGFLRRQKAAPSVTTIPARYFEGTEAEAQRFAATENDKGTQLANHERAGYLRSMREDGRTVAKIEDEAQRLYKRDAATVVALSYLAASGKALDALRALKGGTDDARDAETMAVWVGKTRRAFPQLTDAHEGELWAFARENYKTKGRKLRSYQAWGEYVGPRIERRTEFGSITGPLNFAELPAASRTEIEVDETIAAAERELRQAEAALKKKRRGYIERGATGTRLDRATAKDREAVAVATRDLLALRQSRDRTVAGIRASELSLFANGPAALSAFDQTGLERGEVSDVLAYLGRATYLSAKEAVNGGDAYHYWKDDRGSAHLLYDPADATLYVVPDALVEAAPALPADTDPVAREAAAGLQAVFHGFVPGERAFRVDWPDASKARPQGHATQVRYLSDKLHAAPAVAGGALPEGTVTTGQRGRPRAFKHLFTDTLPVIEIGESEHAVVAVRGVLVTDDGIVN